MSDQTPNTDPGALSYAQAGVDIHAGNALVERIKPIVKGTFRPGVMTGLGGSWVAPGYSSEFTHAYVARNLTEDPLPQDASEDIHTVVVPLAKLNDLIKQGELQDQMTIAIYHMAKHVFDEETAHAEPG